MSHNSAETCLDRPLAGIRVLDLTRVLAGPFCTMVLADLGAEVVKIERPGGDDARQYGPFLPSGESAYFAGINRGKESIVLDLKNETNRATFLSPRPRSSSREQIGGVTTASKTISHPSHRPF